MGLDPTEGQGPLAYSSALAVAERVEVPTPDAPISLPPLPLLPPPLPEPPPQPLLSPSPPPLAAAAFPLPLNFLALASAAAVSPSTEPPPVPPPALRFSVAPPHLDGADVLKDAGTPKTAPSVLHPPPVLALRNTGQYNGGGGDGDSGLEVVGVGEPTTFHLGVESGPMRPRGPGNHSPPAGSPIYGRRCQIRRADPM